MANLVVDLTICAIFVDELEYNRVYYTGHQCTGHSEAQSACLLPAVHPILTRAQSAALNTVSGVSMSPRRQLLKIKARYIHH